jgi:septum formation inhibitor MinC
MHQPQPQPQQKPVNPIQKAVTDQDQKSLDIKAAQLERRIQHKQLIQNMQWLTKAIVRDIAAREDSEANDILDSIGFEESREEQRESFMDEVV